MVGLRVRDQQYRTRSVGKEAAGEVARKAIRSRVLGGIMNGSNGTMVDCGERLRPKLLLRSAAVDPMSFICPPSAPVTMNEYPQLPEQPRTASRRSDLGRDPSPTQSQSESDDDEDEQNLNGSSKKRKRNGDRGVVNVT